MKIYDNKLSFFTVIVAFTFLILSSCNEAGNTEIANINDYCDYEVLHVDWKRTGNSIVKLKTPSTGKILDIEVSKEDGLYLKNLTVSLNSNIINCSIN